jgi:hypothetical protein
MQRLLDRLRGSGVGTEDPNIVGDAGPYDVAPGRDPHAEAIPVEESDEPLPVETAFADEEVGLPTEPETEQEPVDAEPIEMVPGHNVPEPDEVPPAT